MRQEAKKIYQQFESGKKFGDIEANQKTKSAVHRRFLYRQLIDALVSDIITNELTFSTSTLKMMLHRRNSHT